MNSDQQGTLVRALLYISGVSLGWAGVVTTEQWTAFSQEVVGPLTSALGGCITLGAIGWAWWARRTPQMTAALNERSMSQAEVSNLADMVVLKPGIKKIVATPTIAANTKSVNVVAQ